MIQTYKNFSIFKSKPSDNDKLPTHTLSMKIGEEYVTMGGAWTKDSANGKYLSVKLQDAWVNTQDNTKTRKGYVIVAEDDLNALYEHLEGLKGTERVIDPIDNRDLTPDDSNPF